MNDLLFAFIFSVGLNLAMFIPAYLLQTDKLTDASYAITFVGVAIYGLATGSMSTAKIVLFIMVIAWALRLGGFLLWAHTEDEKRQAL